MTDHFSEIKNHTFLVTGSAGFIGYHVARTLLDHGARVVGLDNFNDYYSPALKHDRDRGLRRRPNFIGVAADLADLPALEALFSAHRPQKICHLAAQNHPEGRDRAHRGLLPGTPESILVVRGGQGQEGSRSRTMTACRGPET